MFECIKKWFAKKTETPVGPQEPTAPIVPSFPINLIEFKRQLGIRFLHYNSSQWTGFEIITKKFYELHYDDLRHLAYCLATAVWETAGTMNPITELGGEAYLRSKPYYPYVGRGYVQLTWFGNYQKYGIEKTPEKALDPDFAAYVLIDGMERGVFTGVNLGNYFNWTMNDPVNARRIVNGTDKAHEIAGYYLEILSCLNLSFPLENHDLSSKLNMGDLT